MDAWGRDVCLLSTNALEASMSSNYPPGTKGPEKTEIDMWCDECTHGWTAEAILDLGTYTLCNEEDDICSECGGVAD